MGTGSGSGYPGSGSGSTGSGSGATPLPPTGGNGTGDESTCFQKRTVGAHNYTLIPNNNSAQIASNCMNNCTYKRNDQDGSHYCFATLQVRYYGYYCYYGYFGYYGFF